MKSKFNFASSRAVTGNQEVIAQQIASAIALTKPKSFPKKKLKRMNAAHEFNEKKNERL